MHVPFRYDFVGSFLRPAELKAAREEYASCRIDAAQLTKVEDECIQELVNKQKAAGYHVITDGEFRRSSWHLDFMWGFEGIGHSPTQTGLPFHDENAMLDDTYLVGKIAYKPHPFIEHFRFLKGMEDENVVAKLTIPAPAQFLEQLVMPFAMENTSKYYSSEDELITDLASAYQEFIRDVYDNGCRNLQIDDCSWGMLADPNAKAYFGTDEKGLQRIQEEFLDINNMVIDSKPADMTLTTHVCRGNFHSTWANTGGYDAVASTLLAREHVDAFYLEYDSERAGGFEPLKAVPEGRKVVLGLITTKSPQLEDKDMVIGRIQKAAQYIPLENLCLSPQCGFASCEIGNKLTEEEEWEKLALVKEIAEEVWDGYRTDE